ncbi:hypothetical protein DPMN_186809 [Dreissena polymorpha]|uniref:Uncharacterized protein n=1 Tax=Dreissena polymorpha TaxID=45954 RepID=A0A9D4DQB6_DREPO|nr:hypothetical protein DPMN_186809 [Dreissena polymorpha]
MSVRETELYPLSRNGASEKQSYIPYLVKERQRNRVISLPRNGASENQSYIPYHVTERQRNRVISPTT